ncbi:hypothetical protein [Noviherbaspirillum suwonense]|uniref:Uncharacterized protein n=1 Tax=Noviherbaspirillum suwonense TaxID=1224511 RepID=A0ABY1QKX3_9BURK|nr:hypothetical protein [Noviherbaspirillum suwonense]SMP71937.1 hypothetical protein SAMN06295970_11795 [Noviherbaspirillum suwonense]
MGLRDEILARTDCADAVAARDLDALAALVSAGRTATQRVPIEDVQAHLQSSGLWWPIKAVAAQSQHPAYQAAVAILDVAEARYQRLDMTLPIIAQMLGGLVATGVMPQSEMDSLIAMSVIPDPVSRADVEAALFNPDGSMK